MVERYSMIGRDFGARMDVRSNGAWVRYCDLAAARAEIERLTKERDEARAQVTATDLERIAADFEKDSNLDRYICCNGRDCGCQGATAGAYAAYKIRALAGDGK